MVKGLKTVCICLMLSMVGNSSEACEMPIHDKPVEISSSRASIMRLSGVTRKPYVDTMMLGYANNCVSVKAEPKICCATVGELDFNDSFNYVVVNEDWVRIIKGSIDGYIRRSKVSDENLESHEVTMPWTRGFKSYMGYTAIGCGRQKMVQNIAYTGDYGIREVEGRYCIAVGTACGAGVGDYADLILENDTVIPVVIGDIKANIHTQNNNLITSHNGCCSEFIVDNRHLDRVAKRMGDISACKDEWGSRVVKIKVYNKNCLE